MLFRLVLGIGSDAQCLESVVEFALRIQNPGSGDLPLDVNLFSPIIVFGRL